MGADTLALEPSVPDDWQRFFPVGGSVISSNTGFIYAGFTPMSRRSDPGGYMTSVAALRTPEMAQTGEIDAVAPFASLAVSTDGLMLYAANTEARSVTVIDTTAMRVIRTISDLGQFPALILVQP